MFGKFSLLEFCSCRICFLLRENFQSHVQKMWKKVLERVRKLARQPRHDRDGMDTYRAALLLKCHEWHVHPDRIGTTVQPKKEDVEKFYADVNSLETEYLKEYATTRLNEQVLNMFTHIRDSGVVSTNNNKNGSNLSKIRASPAINNSRHSLMKSIGFELDCRASKCSSDAGNGVFIRMHQDGIIAPGTVLAFFPGLVHLPEYTTKKGYVTEKLLPDPHLMLMCRLDNTIIDGRTADKCPRNPYALAHLVNHVPKGSMPNVQQYPYDFPGDPLGKEEFPRELQYLIPNEYSAKPTLLGTIDRSAMMRGAVLLAARPLKHGDELYMDYRLNPMGGALPSWYTAYNPEGETTSN